jgi:hypothetical protein
LGKVVRAASDVRCVILRRDENSRHPEAAQTAKDLGGDDRNHNAPVVVF